MASATNTAKNKRILRPADRKKRRRGPFGGLILRILVVNIIAPLVLVFGILYLSQYRDNLIDAELETLKANAQLFAGAVADSAIRPVDAGGPATMFAAKPDEIEKLVPDLSRRVIRRLAEAMGSREQLFDTTGKLIGDSEQPAPAVPAGPTGKSVKSVLPKPAAPVVPPMKTEFSDILRYVARNLLQLFPTKGEALPLWTAGDSTKVADYPDALGALKGHISATAWSDGHGNIILSAAAPVKKGRQVMGAVMLTKNGDDIEAAMIEVRFDVLTMFLIALTLTVLLSIYLAGVIGRPLRRLAVAAESIHQGKSRNITIPDLSARRDEIGELSVALRDMTQALWDRMDTIERFAADVAHEIKNPLTSLRSAVETAARVRSLQDRERLMDIILHDVQRLDRLISDISNASRLDAELSRDEMGTVDLRLLLEQLADMHRPALDRGHDGDGIERPVLLDLPAKVDLLARGNESRLAQVFENLIANALSFAPGKPVLVRVALEKKQIVVTVQDAGPGIPPGKLENIFERFYSERPKHEDYGSHSGLGLSIARQIVTAHNGVIFAENMVDAAGKIAGARFTVILDAAD